MIRQVPLHSQNLLCVLLLIRSSLDPVLNIVKNWLGLSIGPGALLNLLIIGVAIKMVISSKFLLPRKAVVCWGGFLCACFISTLISATKLESIRSFLTVFSYFSVFLVMFYTVKSERDFFYLQKIFVYSSIVPIVFGLYQLLFGGYVGFGEIERVSGTFSHPNIFAFYLLLILCVVFCLHRMGTLEKIFPKKLQLVYLAFIIALLLMTQTRSALIALVFMCLFFSYFRQKKYIYYFAVILPIGMLVPSVQDRFLSLLEGNDVMAIEEGVAINSLAWRIVLWEDAWQKILESPVMGWGFDTFSHYSPLFFSLESFNGFDAHNIYVQLLFDCGIFGLIGFLLILFYVACWLLKYVSPNLRDQDFIFLSLLACYFLIGGSDNILKYLSFNWYFWALLGGYVSYKYNLSSKLLANRFES